MAKSPEPADALSTLDLHTPAGEPAPASAGGGQDDPAPILGKFLHEPMSAADVSAEQLPYRSWDRYRIESFLGAGGMGAVYKARDLRLNRKVAIKLLRGGQAAPFDTRQRRHFEREARAQASIEHPHICKIYEVGEIEGQPYIAMQLIQGGSLANLQQVMTRDDKVRAVQKVTEALHAAHVQGLIHRDIKPANILVERRPDGTFWPYLMDFGLARQVDSSTQTSMGGAEGTPAFMAPEQARGEKKQLDARTDIYGLGSTLYSVVAGRPPFVGNSTDVLLALLLEEPPRPRTFDPAIPPALETIITKCLEKEPARRYASAQALAEDLGRYLDGARITARPPGPLRRVGQFAKRRKLLVASATAVLLTSLILGAVALRIRWQAAAQARLAQRLGQEIKDMEWLLRSSRQLQLHDLEREKSIVRLRMSELQSELLGYGQLSRGMAHYALGRGHLALHEYPQALVELRAALSLGYKDAELHYALGLVLGKHFEQASYEARLSGGGDWAKKQLKDLEPSFLLPAIASLRVSRSLKRESPEYLDGLIAYYQRDYDRALHKAQAALREAPWLYEAAKLQGDVHLERALQARDRGRVAEAEREFAGAVTSYEAAAAEGRSDAEVYEGLAEAWVRQIEMTVRSGRPTEEAYAKAVAASDKLIAAEPQSLAGPLKKAYAAMMTMSTLLVGLGSSEKVRHCLAAAAVVLAKQPGHPYGSDVAAICYMSAAEVARKRGEQPEPFLRKAVSLLESTIQQHPHFLWGINDLGNAYALLAFELQLHGHPSARELLHKALQQFSQSAALDPSFPTAPNNSLTALVSLVSEAQSEEELRRTLAQADGFLARCTSINSQDQQCHNNYFQGYARAASRTLLAGHDPQPRLQRALEYLTLTRKLGSHLLDAEQHAALAHLVQARDLLAHHRDPAVALAQLRGDLAACWDIAAQDVVCRTLAAQAEWVAADWQASRNQSSTASLNTALTRALLATQSPEPYPDAWHTLAETYLRLARSAPPRLRAQHVAQGLLAVQKLFAINPSHALGLATKGRLLLLRAQSESDSVVRQSVVHAADQAMEQARKNDRLLAL